MRLRRFCVAKGAAIPSIEEEPVHVCLDLNRVRHTLLTL